MRHSSVVSVVATTAARSSERSEASPASRSVPIQRDEDANERTRMNAFRTDTVGTVRRR